MSEAAAPHPDFRSELVRLMPNLRAFARSLCPNPARADDLVQDTLVKALSNKDRFQPGTNMGAWLFTILRNTYYSDLRKSKREVEDGEGEHAASLADLPNQNSSADLQDFKRAFAKLNDDHREILTLVGAFGMPYEEAAEICGCAVGTVKSRVSRARKRLAELLNIDEGEMASSDEVTRLPQGVIAGSW
jgi:RNA polymerase sigma-70 factor (ECF subfamily)